VYNINLSIRTNRNIKGILSSNSNLLFKVIFEHYQPYFFSSKIESVFGSEVTSGVQFRGGGGGKVCVKVYHRDTLHFGF
jgi:hypothetical protein